MTGRTKEAGLFHGTRALVVILGVHGGGVANTKWLLAQGAKVSVTDLRTKEELAHSIGQFTPDEMRKITFILGGQRKKDFATHDLILAGPGVPRDSVYLRVAREHHKRIENDASVFFRFIKNPVIAVTGTRGKTTTTQWIATLLQKKYPKVRHSGNTPENAFLKEFKRINGKNIPVVAEMSSWQLEYLPASGRAPRVAVITNLYPDHLNRYNGIKDYANAKANIFTGQGDSDFLVLNYDNEWTAYFLKKKPRASVFFISKKQLPKNCNGVYVQNETLFFRYAGVEQKLFSTKKFSSLRGAHNLENLMNALLAVKLFDPTIAIRESDALLKLGTPQMRQELVAKKGNVTVVNDSCATSPDGTIAAIERFRKLGNIVLIAGGTDKDLEFDELAKMIKKHIPIDQTILLEGSATTKLVKNFPPMSRRGLDKKVQKNLDSCVNEAFSITKKLKGKTTILFSPGSASFEKFLHEFDRGEQFNKLVKRHIK